MSELEGHHEQVYKAALAGLLHDVGKLGRLAGEVAPGGYAHAEVGKRFVEGYTPAHWHAALAPVGWHHGEREDGKLVRPIEDLGLPVKLVALADRLSSGERETRDEEAPRAKGLLSPFGRIPDPAKLLEIPPEERQWVAKLWFPARKLSLDPDTLFPKAEPDVGGVSSLWEGLKDAARSIQNVYSSGDATIDVYLESMFYLLRDYTWCVPSAYWHSEPDVSLFAHLHTTAALAACLAHSVHLTGSLSEDNVDGLLAAIKVEPWPQDRPVAGLLAGDLSGIQRFLYSLHNPEGAAASLRARSFYLQILTEAIARWLLRELGLPITNALYIGGGGFTLIVPSSAGERLGELRREINERLCKVHGMPLYLGLAYVELVPDDFRLRSGGLAAKEEKLREELEQSKDRRFSELPDELLKNLFSPRGFGGAAGEADPKLVVCDVCGVETSRDLVDEVDDVLFCPNCKGFRQLGRDLVRARYLFLGHIPSRPLPEKDPHTFEDLLASFGAKVAVKRSPKELPPERPATLFALVDDEDLPTAPKLAVGRRFLVNVVPTVSDGEERREIEGMLRSGEAGAPEVGNLKHFGILTRQSKGAPYLGVLRMDMDNLGRIFSKGLGMYATLSRISTLSFLLTVFFEGWVEQIARVVNREHEKGWQRIYTVYSGGDDLFFVGSWDAVVELAQRIRRDLRKFTGREELGISGGIALVHEKYPLYLAAEDALRVEESAKAVKRGGGREKDGFTFLGIALPWEEFGYDEQEGTASDWAERLEELVKEERLPRGLLGRVQRFYHWYCEERSQRGEKGPWNWHAAYWLSRMLDRVEKADEDARRALLELREALAGDGFGRNIARLALAARWAELATRKGG